jgi:hypothetical protein
MKSRSLSLVDRRFTIGINRCARFLSLEKPGRFSILTPTGSMAWRKALSLEARSKPYPPLPVPRKLASRQLRSSGIWISLIVHRVQPMAYSRFYAILRLLMARSSTARSILPDFTMRVSARK